MLTKKKQDRTIRFRTGKLLLLGMFFGGGIFVSGMSAQAEMTAEEAAGWLAGYGFTDVNIYGREQDGTFLAECEESKMVGFEIRLNPTEKKVTLTGSAEVFGAESNAETDGQNDQWVCADRYVWNG